MTRVKAILMQPNTEWPVIDAEPATVASIYTGYVMILAAIPAVCGLIGFAVFGYGISWAIRYAVGRYVGALVGTYVLALIIDALAPTFGGQKNQVAALKVAAYSATASWVVGVVLLVPALAALGLLGLYSLYLLYTGLPVLMKAPADRASVYTVVVIVAAIIVFFVIGAITSSLTGGVGRFGY